MVYAYYPRNYRLRISRTGNCGIANGNYPGNVTCNGRRLARPAHVVADAIHTRNYLRSHYPIGASGPIPGKRVTRIITTLSDIILRTPVRINSIILRGIYSAKTSVIAYHSVTWEPFYAGSGRPLRLTIQ